MPTDERPERRGDPEGAQPTAVEAFDYHDGKLFCEQVAAEELVAAFGTPLYVYSQASILERFRAFRDAFAPLDPLIAYSVKANGNLALLRLLAEQGSGADIVSGGELYRAQLAGIPAERIVFSGVGKTVAELATALNAGIYGFNVESEGELRQLAALGEAMQVQAPIALRVNPDVEAATPHEYTRTGHHDTKFGIPVDEARRLYHAAARMPGLRLRGIDVHIGSQILDAEPYVLAVQRVLQLADELARAGTRLEYVDIGGGFGVAYDEDDEPEPAHFADALVPLLRDAGLRVVLEPGRYIVGPAGVLLTRVLYTKEFAKTFVVTDAGMNDLLRPSHYASYHRVAPVELHPERDQVKVDVVGPICESGDFLALDRVVERVREGELLAISTTGAYGFSMASTYNARPRAAEVLVDGDRYRLIRQRETVADLVRGEVELLGEPAPGAAAVGAGSRGGTRAGPGPAAGGPPAASAAPAPQRPPPNAPAR